MGNAFVGCTSLKMISVDVQNVFYSSLNGVLFNKSQTVLVQYPAGIGGSYIIPNTVTNIGDDAFDSCAGLTDVTIGDNVTSIGLRAFNGCARLAGVTISKSVGSIGFWAFGHCTDLMGIYFGGNIPLSVDSTAFNGDNSATVYYLPGTTGWGSTFGGRPTALWSLPNPVILNSRPSFGLGTHGFGFIISWATNVPVVVEATTNPANPTWSPLATNTLASGSAYFSDPGWTNYPGRFYRLRSP